MSDPIIRAPFTPDQIASLEAFQESEHLRPYACSPHCPARGYVAHNEDTLPLAADRNGLHCIEAGSCGYVQTWAFTSTLDWSWQQQEIQVKAAAARGGPQVVPEGQEGYGHARRRVHPERLDQARRSPAHHRRGLCPDVQPGRELEVPLIRFPVDLAREYLVVRRNGENLGPYRNEVDARRDYGQFRGASLYRRWVVRARYYRLVESKSWDAEKRGQPAP